MSLRRAPINDPMMSSGAIQDVLRNNLPQCASICYEAATNATCTDVDLDCICANSATSTQAATCIVSTCTVREQLSTENETMSICGIEPKTDYTYQPIMIVFLVLASTAFFLRCLARATLGNKIWWDDFTNTCAMACALVFAVVLLILKPLGLGVDMWAVPLDNISTIFLNIYVSSVFYTAGRYFIRTSILLFYLRIFTFNPIRKMTIFTLIFIVAEGISYTLPNIFQCSTVSSFWLGWDGEHPGTCINLRNLGLVSVVLGIVCDIWMILFPLPFISRLKIPLRQKLKVAVLFALGITITAINIARLPDLINYQTSTNPTLDQVQLIYLSALELDIGVIITCLPTIQGLVKPIQSLSESWSRSWSRISKGTSKSEVSTRNTVQQVPTSSHEGPPLLPDKGDLSNNMVNTHIPATNIMQTTTVSRRDDIYNGETGISMDDLNMTPGSPAAVNVRAWA